MPYNLCPKPHALCPRRLSSEALPLELAAAPPMLSEPSHIVHDSDDLRALAGVLPARFALGSWKLVRSNSSWRVVGLEVINLGRGAGGRGKGGLVDPAGRCAFPWGFG